GSIRQAERRGGRSDLVDAPTAVAPAASIEAASTHRARVDLALVPVWAVAAVLVVAAAVRARDGHATVDLALFEQAVWNASHLRAPSSTIVGGSVLGDHFAPGLLLFAPLYAVVASPIWFFVAQGAAAAGAVTGLVRRVRSSAGP